MFATDTVLTYSPHFPTMALRTNTRCMLTWLLKGNAVVKLGAAPAVRGDAVEMASIPLSLLTMRPLWVIGQASELNSKSLAARPVLSPVVTHVSIVTI